MQPNWRSSGSPMGLYVWPQRTIRPIVVPLEAAVARSAGSLVIQSLRLSIFQHAPSHHLPNTTHPTSRVDGDAAIHLQWYPVVAAVAARRPPSAVRRSAARRPPSAASAAQAPQCSGVIAALCDVIVSRLITVGERWERQGGPDAPVRRRRRPVDGAAKTGKCVLFHEARTGKGLCQWEYASGNIGGEIRAGCCTYIYLYQAREHMKRGLCWTN